MSQVIHRIILTLRTVRFIKPSQLLYRIWFKLRRVSPPTTSPAAELRTRAEWIRPIPKTKALAGNGHYTFLNSTMDFTGGVDWSSSSVSRLWLYNLHYFDFINSDDVLDTTPAALETIRDWVGVNPPTQGTGWEPYPTSLRIVNWVKWQITVEEYPEDILDSLVVQIRWLSKTVEYHILANHLFTNGKALVYAGVFFSDVEADRWLALGLKIVNAELKEQILADGGHFERSPMYHHTILEDLLDLINLAQATPGSISDQTLAHWKTTAVDMLGWARSMNHPSGEIAFFNDAAYGIAPDLAKLTHYAKQLGIPDKSASTVLKQSHLLAPTGFALLESANSRVIADVGPVGPDYQPGHAHADTLSFELAHKGELLIVNSGTSTYEPGELRQYQRSTRAHSTVEVNGLDSSEVWAGFRVARRANPFGIEFETNDTSTSVAGSHDGYRRLASPVTHTRRWVLDDATLQITDWLTGDPGTAVARFYLHPDVQVVYGKELVTKGGSRIGWDVQGGIAKIERSVWYPAFGRSVENFHIAVTLTENPSEFTLNFS